MNKEQAEQVLLQVIHTLKLTTQERETLLQALMVLKSVGTPGQIASVK